MYIYIQRGVVRKNALCVVDSKILVWTEGRGEKTIAGAIKKGNKWSSKIHTEKRNMHEGNK